MMHLNELFYIYDHIQLTKCNGSIDRCCPSMKWTKHHRQIKLKKMFDDEQAKMKMKIETKTLVQKNIDFFVGLFINIMMMKCYIFFCFILFCFPFTSFIHWLHGPWNTEEVNRKKNAHTQTQADTVISKKKNAKFVHPK